MSGFHHEDDSTRVACPTVGCNFRVRVFANTPDDANRLAAAALTAHTCVSIPDQWPPQIGDLWIGNHKTWIVGNHLDDGLRFVPISNLDPFEWVDAEQFLSRCLPAHLVQRLTDPAE